jgi:hypothetical protein
VLKLPDETKPDLGNIITKEFWQALLWENPKFGAKKKHIKSSQMRILHMLHGKRHKIRASPVVLTM